MRYDVIIIGAGPGGCLASIGIKQKNPNLRVLIIEKNKISLPRIGEALLTGTIYTLDQAGILDEVLSKYDWQRKIGASYLWGKDRKKPWYVNYESLGNYPKAMINEDNQVLTLHVIRHRFDEGLKEIALSKGVVIVYGECDNFRFVEDNLIYAKVVGKKYYADYWLDATGQTAILANQNHERQSLGLNRTTKYFYTDSIDWTVAKENGYEKNRTNILSNKDGWLWFIHLGKEGGKDLTSVGFVGQSKQVGELTKENIIGKFGEFGEFGLTQRTNFYNAYGEFLEELYFHPEYTYVSERLVGSNWALVGDAALFLDPILSQGVTLAAHYGLMHGYAAVDFLQGNKLSPVKVVEHYKKEAEILKEVINFWYEKNYDKDDWRSITYSIIGDGEESIGLGDSFRYITYSIIGDGEESIGLGDSFRYITNLENLRKEYHPFTKDQQVQIEKNINHENK